MVRGCIVCGKVDALFPDLSFHRFPQDAEKKALWFSLVGVPKGRLLPKHPWLCSDHFYPEDIQIRSNGAKIIRRYANPRRCEGVLFLDEASSSSDSTISDEPQLSKRNPKIVQVFEDIITGCPDSSSDMDFDVKNSSIMIFEEPLLPKEEKKDPNIDQIFVDDIMECPKPAPDMDFDTKNSDVTTFEEPLLPKEENGNPKVAQMIVDIKLEFPEPTSNIDFDMKNSGISIFEESLLLKEEKEDRKSDITIFEEPLLPKKEKEDPNCDITFFEEPLQPKEEKEDPETPDFDSITPTPGSSRISETASLEFSGEYTSSETETASETGESFSATVQPSLLCSKRKKWKRRYVGDLTSSDFSTPEKRDKNLIILKTTILCQRKKIHVLQTHVRRLKKRINTLEGELKVLRRKVLLQDERSQPYG